MARRVKEQQEEARLQMRRFRGDNRRTNSRGMYAMSMVELSILVDSLERLELGAEVRNQKWWIIERIGGARKRFRDIFHEWTSGKENIASKKKKKRRGGGGNDRMH